MGGRGDFMGGRGAGFGGSGKNKVIGLRVAYKNMNGHANYIDIMPVKGSKNKLIGMSSEGMNRPRQFTQMGGLKAWYNKNKDNSRWKIFPITKGQREEELRTFAYSNRGRGIKWEDL